MTGRIGRGGTLPRRTDRPSQPIPSTAPATRPMLPPEPTAGQIERYKRIGSDEMDESFFPVLWREDGYRTPFLDGGA